MTRLLVIGVALSLTACAGLAPVTEPEPEQWTQRQQQLSAVTAWQISGRASFHEGDQAWQGQLAWQQQADAYRIQFSASHGQTAVMLEGDAAGVVLRLGDGSEHQARDLRALLSGKLGWSLPFDALRYWLLGQPRPGARSALAFNDSGELIRLRSGSWTVDYKRYQSWQGIVLPARIFIESDDGAGMRLVIDRWQLEL